jgi:hypothetical protein
MSEEQVKYSSYTPAQKKASQVYRMKNKDKINEQRKKYYQARKEADPAFLEYKRKKAKEYYEKKKIEKATGIVAKDLHIDVEELKTLLVEEDKRDPIITETPIIPEVKPIEDVPESVEEVKVEKPKRVRKPKALEVDTSKPEPSKSPKNKSKTKSKQSLRSNN